MATAKGNVLQILMLSGLEECVVDSQLIAFSLAYNNAPDFGNRTVAMRVGIGAVVRTGGRDSALPCRLSPKFRNCQACL